MELRKRILLVDDDGQVLFVLQTALVKLGKEYEVVTARTGHEALAQLESESFDLLITDLRMPGIGGADLTEEVMLRNPGAVVIWFTAFGCDSVRAQALELGVYRCLDKPVEVDELRQIVREALTSAERPQPSVAGRE